jgi:hypothetical protein
MFSDIVDELATLGSYDSFGKNTFSFNDVQKFLKEGLE